LLTLPDQGQPMPTSIIMTELPAFLERDSKRADYGTRDLRGGFTIELWLQLDSMDPNQIILDNRTASGQGFCLCTTSRGTVQVVLNDGRTESRWECDPGMLRVAKAHHIVVIVDGGPKSISFVIDGKLSDGGDFRQFGWGRYNPNLRGIRLYARALLVSEAVGNYRACRARCSGVPALPAQMGNRPPLHPPSNASLRRGTQQRHQGDKSCRADV